MTPTQHTRDQADDQASLWAARLRSGPLSAERQDELRAWLAGCASHAALLDEYCETSADYEAALAVANTEGRAELPALEKRRTGRRVWLTACAAAAVAVLAFALWPRIGETLSTAPGHRESFTLADGSVLHLSANTRVVVTLGHRERRARIEAGEAMFEVSKDAARPFHVTTGHGGIRVLGTVFNVRADATDGEEVTLLEGAIEVSGQAGTSPVTIKPGQQALLYGQAPSIRALTPQELQRVTTWREGVIVFEGESLRSALERVAWYHGRKISVSAKLDGVALGGRYRLDDYDTLLKDVRQVTPVAIIQSPDGSARVVPR